MGQRERDLSMNDSMHISQLIPNTLSLSNSDQELTHIRQGHDLKHNRALGEGQVPMIRLYKEVGRRLSQMHLGESHD